MPGTKINVGTLTQSPSQTIGPFFAYGLTAAQYGYPFSDVVGTRLANETTEGEPIRLTGQVFDGVGAPINDCLLYTSPSPRDS